MLIAYLLIGFLFGTGTAAYALVNDGGILMALLAYSASGALAILVPLMLQSLFQADQSDAWADDQTGHLSA